MNNRNIVSLFVLIFLMCMGCKENTSQSLKSISEIQFTGDSLKFTNIHNKEISLQINNDILLSQQNSKDNDIAISVIDIVRKCKDKNETALLALKNKNTLPVNVKITGEIDTTFFCEIEPFYESERFFSISGECSPLISKYSNPSQSTDLKKWLFRNNEPLDDDNIKLLTGLVNQLSRNNTIEYNATTSIPVIHSFAGKKYRVNSSLKGDYYVLYACSDSKEINEFVEDIVANDFDLCSKSLNIPLDCYRKSESNGYKCICLIALNKDWSYKIQPLGLVAVDNIAPVSSKSSYEKDISFINFPNGVKVNFPPDKPNINGLCDVAITNSSGNGIECNVSFRVYFDGDVKSVTVKRTKNLCYDGWTHKVENKTIELKDKTSPYLFTYNLHLKDGDNYIPIIVEDNHGNKREFELNERAHFVRDNSPSINIDNNIDIYN